MTTTTATATIPIDTTGSSLEGELAQLRAELETINRAREEKIRAIEAVKAKLGLGPCCWLYELSLQYHTSECELYEGR